jgi:hypothetical protein
MKLIPLNTKWQKSTIKRTAVIDDEDFEKVNKYNWSFSNSGTGYASSNINGIYTRMHRFILDAQAGESVDHINHNGLDNRKVNLRVVSQRENCLNRIDQGKFPGVRKCGSGFNASIHYCGEQIYLGHYDNPYYASFEYDSLVDFIEHVDDILNDSYQINLFEEETPDFI